MKLAFEEAGLLPRVVALRRAHALFLNQGGTIDELQAEVDLCRERMPREDQCCRAPQRLRSDVDPQQPVEGGGAKRRMSDKDHSSIASPSSSSRDRGDQSTYAQSSQERDVPPVREPTPNYLKAVADSRKEAARSVLFKCKTSTGVFWGDVHPYEITAMTRDSIRGMALMAAVGPLNNKQMQMTFGQLLKPEVAQIAMERADKEIAHAH